MIAFKKIQYADADGKTPADYLCELLNGGIDVMKLATFMSQIPNEGTLKGTALKKTKRMHDWPKELKDSTRNQIQLR